MNKALIYCIMLKVIRYIEYLLSIILREILLKNSQCFHLFFFSFKFLPFCFRYAVFLNKNIFWKNIIYLMRCSIQRNLFNLYHIALDRFYY